MPNDLPLIHAALAPFRENLHGVAVESTCNAYWLIDGLQAAGYPMQMVNTLAVPQCAGLKHGDDDSDAQHLANLMRLGLLPTAYIYPREQRPLRRRMLLVQQSVRLLQSVQGYHHTALRLVFGGRLVLVCGGSVRSNAARQPRAPIAVQRIQRQAQRQPHQETDPRRAAQVEHQ